MSTVFSWIILCISLLNIISGYRHNRHHQLFSKYTDPDRKLEEQEIADVKYARTHRHRHRQKQKPAMHKHITKINKNAWDPINHLALARVEAYNNYYNEDEMIDEMVIDHAAIVTTSNKMGKRALFRYHGGNIQIRWPKTGSQNKGADAWDAYKKFLWHDMAKKFNAGVFDAAGRYAGMENRITGFREKCKDELLVETNGDGSAAANRLVCYDNMGSNNPTSDLDFTLVRWDEPNNVVTKLSSFYSQCLALLGSFPIDVFDMNFYVATCIVSRKPAVKSQSRNCYGEVHVNIQNNILTRIDNAANADYAVYGICEVYHNVDADLNHGAFYLRFSEHLEFYLIRRRIKSWNPLTPPDALDILVKVAKVYYNEIHRLQLGDIALVNVGNTRISNDNLLYIKALLLWMNYHSDESYISNIALESIWMAQKGERGVQWSMPGVGAPNGGAGYQKPNFANAPSVQKRVLLALDCFGFVEKYFVEAKKLTFTGLVTPRDDKMINRKKSLEFIDRISKYIERIGDFISPVVLDTNAGKFLRVGNGGIPNWEGGNDAAPTYTTAKVIGIDAADRKIFMRLYRQMRIWVAKVRGKTPLEDVLTQYSNKNAAGTSEQRGAQILFDVTESGSAKGFGKLDTPIKIKTLLEKISDGMIAYMEGRVTKNNKKTLENAMNEILSQVKTKIKLTPKTINYKADTSKLDKTYESNEKINLFAKASATPSPSNKWEWAHP